MHFLKLLGLHRRVKSDTAVQPEQLTEDVVPGRRSFVDSIVSSVLSPSILSSGPTTPTSVTSTPLHHQTPLARRNNSVARPFIVAPVPRVRSAADEYQILQERLTFLKAQNASYRATANKARVEYQQLLAEEREREAQRRLLAGKKQALKERLNGIEGGGNIDWRDDWEVLREQIRTFVATPPSRDYCGDTFNGTIPPMCHGDKFTSPTQDEDRSVSPINAGNQQTPPWATDAILIARRQAREANQAYLWWRRRAIEDPEIRGTGVSTPSISQLSMTSIDIEINELLEKAKSDKGLEAEDMRRLMEFTRSSLEEDAANEEEPWMEEYRKIEEEFERKEREEDGGASAAEHTMTMVIESDYVQNVDEGSISESTEDVNDELLNGGFTREARRLAQMDLVNVQGVNYDREFRKETGLLAQMNVIENRAIKELSFDKEVAILARMRVVEHPDMDEDNAKVVEHTGTPEEVDMDELPDIADEEENEANEEGDVGELEVAEQCDINQAIIESSSNQMPSHSSSADVISPTSVSIDVTAFGSAPSTALSSIDSVDREQDFGKMSEVDKLLHLLKDSSCRRAQARTDHVQNSERPKKDMMTRVKQMDTIDEIAAQLYRTPELEEDLDEDTGNCSENVTPAQSQVLRWMPEIATEDHNKGQDITRMGRIDAFLYAMGQADFNWVPGRKWSLQMDDYIQSKRPAAEEQMRPGAPEIVEVPQSVEEPTTEPEVEESDSDSDVQDVIYSPDKRRPTSLDGMVRLIMTAGPRATDVPSAFSSNQQETVREPSHRPLAETLSPSRRPLKKSSIPVLIDVNSNVVSTRAQLNAVSSRIPVPSARKNRRRFSPLKVFTRSASLSRIPARVQPSTVPVETKRLSKLSIKRMSRSISKIVPGNSKRNNDENIRVSVTSHRSASGKFSPLSSRLPMLRKKH